MNNLTQNINPVSNNSLNNQYNNNNLEINSLMSNQNKDQQNINPQGQTLGGYHNQGFGSHQPNQQNKKNEALHWNDFSGIMKPEYEHQNQNQK